MNNDLRPRQDLLPSSPSNAETLRRLLGKTSSEARDGTESSQTFDEYVQFYKKENLNVCECMFDNSPCLHSIPLQMRNDLVLRVAKKFGKDFREDMFCDIIYDLCALVCVGIPCGTTVTNGSHTVQSSIDTIFWMCHLNEFEAEEALFNFIYSREDIFPRICKFYEDLLPSFTPQIKPIKSCIKETKKRSSLVDSRFFKPTPPQFVTNLLKRDEIRTKEISKKVKRFIDAKRSQKRDFVPQILGTEDIAKSIDNLCETLAAGIDMNHNISTEDNFPLPIEHKLQVPDFAKCSKGALILIAALFVTWRYREKIQQVPYLIEGIIASITTVIGVVYAPRIRAWFNEFQTQSLILDTEYISSCLFSILSLGAYTDNEWKPKFKEFSSMLSSHGRITRALSDMLNFIIETIDKAARFICRDVLGCDYTTLLNSGNSEISAWRDKVDSIELLQRDEMLKINTVNNSKILHLLRLGHELKRKFESGGSHFKRQYELILSTLKTLEKIHEPFKKANFAQNGLRTKPLTVLLMGKSGVGKSAVTIPMINALLARTLPVDELEHLENNPMDFVYVCCPETGFMDGYASQTVCVYDDFMQTIDGPMQPDGEAMKLIRASNLFPYNMHMAHLEDKGNTYFGSKVCFATTNNSNLKSDLLREPEALLRRFDVVAQVFPKKEYCVNNAELPADRRLKPLENFTFDCYEFNLCKLNKTDKTWQVTDRFDYDSFMDYLVSSFNGSQGQGERYLDSVRSNLSEEIRRRKKQEGFVPQILDHERIKIREFISERPRLSSLLCDISMLMTMWKPILLCGLGFVGSIYALNSFFSHQKRSLKDVIKRFCTTDKGEIVVPEKLLEFDDDHDFSDLDLQSVGLIGGKLQQARLRVKQSTDLDTLKQFTPQLKVCNTTEQVADCVLKNNWYCLVVEEGECIGNALSIGGDIFIMNAHYYPSFKRWSNEGKKRLYFAHPSDWLAGTWKDTAFIALLENLVMNPPTERENQFDSWIFRLHGSRPHRWIIESFACEKTYAMYQKEIPGVMYYVRTQRLDGEGELGLQPYIRFMTRNTKLSPTLSVGDVSWADYVSFPLMTIGGDCGSLLFINEDVTRGGRLVGIHAGYSNQNSLAIGVVCTRERIISLLEAKFGTIDSLKQRSVQPEGVAEVQGHLLSMQIRGTSPHTYFPIGTSKLRKSCCFEAVGNSDLCPAILRPNSSGDPMEIALEKYSSQSMQVSLRYLNIAVANYSELLLSIKTTRQKRILTFEEACAGIDGDPYINAIPRNTSAGYPYNLWVSKPGKWDIFGEDQEYSLVTPLALQLRAECESMINMMKQGKRPMHYYVDCLKDELRSLDKVKKCSTRMFSSSPLPLVALTKIFFGQFSAFFMENRLKNEGAVGINPYTEWDVMAKLLKKRGTNIVAGDYSRFDASQLAMILRELIDIINNWYSDSEENQRVREILFMETWNSFHINSGLTLEWVKSLPSGHPLTTIINCMFNSIAFRMAFGKCFDSPNAITRFRENVELVVYGDDNIASVSEKAAEHFNYYTLTTSMAYFGLTYTTETKEQVSSKFRSLEDVDFLKRGFSLVNGKYIAPLRWDTVRQMVNWYRKGIDEGSRQVANVECALREATLHGENEFELLRKACKPMLEEVGLRLPPYDFTYYSTEFQLEWYEESSLVTDDENELPVNVISNLTEDEKDSNVSTYSGLLPGETQNCQETGCGSRNECIEVQVKSLAASNIKEEMTTTSNVEPVMLNSQGVLNAATDSSATMVFGKGRGDKAYEPFPLKELSPELLAVPSTIQQDIDTFLRHPTKINTFVWSTAAASGTTLLSLKIPFDGAMSSDIAIIKNKLAGMMGFRATAVLKVMISVNKFAQGRLLLHFIPGIPNLVNGSQNMYLYDLTTRTQQPSVDLDIGMQTEAEIRIPFVNASLYYDLTTGSNPWAKFYVTIYSALVGPSSSITGSVYLYFEDAEYVIPTAIQPQMGKKNVSDTETYTGPLSSRFNSISEAFAALNQVPELSSVAAPASWVAKCLAKTASIFGFSKPSTNQPAKIVANVHYPNALTYDGINAHVPLGLSAENKIDILPGFAGNDIDELSIRYLTQRPAFFRSQTWSTSDAVDTNLWVKAISPTSEVNLYSVGGQPCQTAPPVTWICNLFGYMRGDIVLHFKFVKTQFHTGKLALAFDPSPSAAGTMTTSKMAYVHTDIIDISEKSEYHIRLPYSRLTPWIVSNGYFGTVYLVVLTPLNAPSSVSSSIQILMEISGGDNLEVACLRDFAQVPVLDTTFVPQIKESDDMRGESGVTNIGNASITRDPILAERFCIGEKITSLKQVLLRHARLYLGTTGNVKSLQIDPFGLGGDIWDGTTYLAGPLSRDYMSCIAAGFVLIRGGVNLIMQHNGDNVSTSTKSLRASMAITRNGTHALMYTSSIALFDFNSGTYVTNAFCSPSLAVHVPAWSLSHSRYSVTDYTAGSRPWVEAEPRVLVSFVNPSTSATVPQLANTSLFRSMADDASMGYFIGFPLYNPRTDWNGAPSL